MVTKVWDRHRVKQMCPVLMVFIVSWLLLSPMLCLPVGASSGGSRIPYGFSLEDMAGHGGGGTATQMLIDKDWHLMPGEELHFSGWVAVPDGVNQYEYTFVRVDADGTRTEFGSPEWLGPDEMRIFARTDLTGAGIIHPSGHAKAGFDLVINAPRESDGYYDFFLRAADMQGNTYDLLAVTNVAVGFPDSDDGSFYRVNLARLARDPDGQPGLSFPKEGGIRLFADGVLPLGEFGLTAFETVAITYTGSFTEGQGTRAAAIGLKLAEGSTRPAPYRHEGDETYDLRDSLALGRLRSSVESVTVLLDISEIKSRGMLYLSAYLFGNDSVTVTDVTFTYNGKSATRTAARIFFSGDLAPYLSGANAVTAENVRDAELGDVLRIQAMSDTNDPYIYFQAEQLLSEHGIRINADEYRYMVVLARAAKENLYGNMTFYLCAGDIGAPTEALTASTVLECDDKWHYYLLDLSGKDTWAGIVHGWRFDMINAPAVAGNYVDYASVQFFRTEEAALAVASGDPYRPETVFHCGDASVMRDDREEQNSGSDVFIPEETDVYVPTAPETETPQPDTAPESATGEPETSLAGSGESGTQTEPAATSGSTAGLPPSGCGCTSAVGTGIAVLPLLFLPLAIIRKTSTRARETRSRKKDTLL